MNSGNDKHTILVICTESPYGSSKAQEMLDIVLTGAAYEVPVTLLLMEDGAFQLTEEQDGTCVGKKTLLSNLQALEIYGVEQIYACEESIIKRGINLEKSTLNIEISNSSQIAKLISQHSHVLTA